MAVTIQLRRDTHTNLADANPNIAPGEIIIDTTNNRAVVNSTSSTLAYNTAIAAGQYLTLDDSNGRILGGGADEVQLSVKGASTQSDPIFQVTDSGGTNKILSVTDNDATICTIENHGETADNVLVVQGKSGQDQDDSGGDLLQVKPDSGDTGRGLTVDHSGNVVIYPMNDTSADNDTNLKVRMSNSADVGVLIHDPDDALILGVYNTFVRSRQELILGQIPDHAVPNPYPKVRSGTFPDNTDDGAQSAYLTTPHFLLQAEGGDTTNQRGKLTLVGNRGVSTTDNAILIVKNGTDSTPLLKADYGGKLTANDAVVTQTGRTIAANSLVRADEMGYGYRVVNLKSTNFFYNQASGGSQIAFNPFTNPKQRYYYQSDQGGSIVVGFSVGGIDGNNEGISYTDPDGNTINVGFHNQDGALNPQFIFNFQWHMAPGSSFTAFDSNVVTSDDEGDYLSGYVSRMKY